jgi:hypothetical protein
LTVEREWGTVAHATEHRTNAFSARTEKSVVILKMFEREGGTMKNVHRNPKHAWLGVLIAMTVFLLGTVAASEAQSGVPAAEVVWQHVGRVYLDPSTGKAVWAGYVVHINGIDTSLFSGSPSEATAHFTFTTDVLSLTPIATNGDIALSLVSAGTFNVYYNSNPSGDWSNPASFSSGQLIASFTRKESLFPEFGPVGFHNLSESLVSSRRFTFNGRTYDFKYIVPNGVTFAQTFSTTPLTGTTDYPVAFGGVGVTMAVGKNSGW